MCAFVCSCVSLSLSAYVRRATERAKEQRRSAALQASTQSNNAVLLNGVGGSLLGRVGADAKALWTALRTAMLRARTTAAAAATAGR